MSPKIAPVVALLAAAASPAAGFAPPSAASSVSLSSSSSSLSITSSALHMSSIPHHATEDSYPLLLSNASLCANDESCSIESAELYLREIVHVQSGCAAGTLSGANVCDDVTRATEVVAGLRRKIAEGAVREVRTFWDYRHDELETLAASVDGSAAGALTAPLKPAYLAIAALYAMAAIAVLNPSGMDGGSAVVPFTAQEVWWAVRDGYVGDLASHAFHNGGLLVGDTTAAAVSNALSPQEIFWSVRDGYASDTLLSSGATGGAESTPFTPQELWWAVKNGYSYDMLEHWFRNGGLSV